MYSVSIQHKGKQENAKINNYFEEDQKHRGGGALITAAPHIILCIVVSR